MMARARVAAIRGVVGKVRAKAVVAMAESRAASLARSTSSAPTRGAPGVAAAGADVPTGGKPRGGKPGGGRNERPATIDPDSPFAKLAALKADMEKKPKA